MKIIEKKWNEIGLTKRTKTTRIILHHAAATSCTVEDIDRWHRNEGYTCIGYHFFIRKNGEIYRGRREDAVGAHAYGGNLDSIGICFEGNFENENMPKAQLEAGKELITYLKDKYKITKIEKHKDVNATLCPGKNFPFKDMVTEINILVPPVVAPTTEITNIKELQKALNIVVDGIYGKQTETAVTNAKIKKGCLNKEAVKFVQKRLNVIVDGIFGNQTHNAVIAFQKKNKIIQDGWVGNVTMKLLVK